MAKQALATDNDLMAPQEGDELFTVSVRWPGDYLQACIADGTPSDRDTMRQELRKALQEMCNEKGMTIFFDITD